MADLPNSNANQQQQQNFGQLPYLVQQHEFPPKGQSYPPQQATQRLKEDPEDPDVCILDYEFNDKSIRRAFLGKVFFILSVELGITLGVVAIFMFYIEVQYVIYHYFHYHYFYYYNFWVNIASIVLFSIVLIMLGCCENMRRKSPVNYITLFLLTAFMSSMMGILAGINDKFDFFWGISITLASTVGLMIFALQTKWDFTIMRGIFVVTFITHSINLILAQFLYIGIMSLICASFGSFLFCIYLLYDIQLMMDGKHKYSISPEECMFAALNVHVDFIYIFKNFLKTCGTYIFGHSETPKYQILKT